MARQRRSDTMPRKVASILDSAGESGIRDAQHWHGWRVLGRCPWMAAKATRHEERMKVILQVFRVAYAMVAALFAVSALVLVGFAALELWSAVVAFEGKSVSARAASAIESIGLIAVALVALEMAQTVVEEEVVRRVHVSAPTRVRRYLSRFLVVVVIALGIESLVAVVQALHDRPETLPSAAAVAVAAGALLAAWGLFVRLNRAVEELEPEGISEARAEDPKVQ
jgi:hypothetical protein